MKTSYLSILIGVAVLAASCSSQREQRAAAERRAATARTEGITFPHPPPAYAAFPPVTQTDSDRALELAVRQQFNRYGALGNFGKSLHIAAQGGAVTVSGNVTTEQERQMILSMIQTTPGVLSVDSRLTLAGATPYPLNQEDRVIATSVRGALQVQPELAAYAPNLGIHVDKGLVTLTGIAATEADRQQIEAIARSRPDVVAVVNQINVRTPTGRSSADVGGLYSVHVQGLTEADRAVAQKVLQCVQSDTTLSALLPVVSVDVAGEKVTVRGTVQSELERATILAAVRRAVGVGEVIDQLYVRPPR